MSSVNVSNPNIDLTVRVFDEFYGFDVAIPAPQYDAVYAYMRSVFNTNEAAANFTTTLFRVSVESGINVMDLLQEISRYGQPELTSVLAYYLNGLQSSATLLGVQAKVLPNKYVARNVVP
jgi:hypothetical protein